MLSREFLGRANIVRTTECMVSRAVAGVEPGHVYARHGSSLLRLEACSDDIFKAMSLVQEMEQPGQLMLGYCGTWEEQGQSGRVVAEYFDLNVGIYRQIGKVNAETMFQLASRGVA